MFKTAYSLNYYFLFRLLRKPKIKKPAPKTSKIEYSIMLLSLTTLDKTNEITLNK
jgi:hypothetical protein